MKKSIAIAAAMLALTSGLSDGSASGTKYPSIGGSMTSRKKRNPSFAKQKKAKRRLSNKNRKINKR